MQQSVDVFQSLRNIFPGQPLDYIKRATSYVMSVNNGDVQNFVLNAITGDVADAMVAEVMAYEPHPEVEGYLGVEYAFLMEALPDAEKGYLAQIFRDYAGKTELQDFISHAVVTGTYPKRVKPQETVKIFDVELYVKLVPDPKTSFSHENYIMTNRMKKDAAAYLSTIFTGSDIVSIVEETHSLYLAYQKLCDQCDPCENGDYEVPAELKTPQPDKFIEPDYDQVFEKLFIENESEIVSFLEKIREEDQKQFALMEKEGLLRECPICVAMILPSHLLEMCATGHVACTSCVKTYTEKCFSAKACVEFKCLSCELLIPDSIVIQAAWDSARVSQLLEVRFTQRNPDLPHCPKCNHPSNDKCDDDVTCANCEHTFCVKCKKAAHAPTDCFKHENDVCKTVEEAMSKELIRHCPYCQRALIKEAGCCNRIKCVCGQYMCYVCRTGLPCDTTYKHFYGQGILPSEANGACPLHSDINNLHVHNVISKGKAEFKNVLESNPGVKLLYDPLQILPESSDSDAVPGQY